MSAPIDTSSPAAALYVDLLKRCLVNTIYPEFDGDISGSGYLSIPREQVRREGRDWPRMAHTMIGSLRLQNLHTCIETVLREGVPGDLLEAGVWRGGASIFMAGMLKAYGVTDRVVWMADSFEGVPRANPEKYPLDAGLDRALQDPNLAVSLERVKANFAHYDLLNDRVRVLKGWFKDTLPTAPVEKLAVLRADGDLYESTTDILTNLYPKVSPGGFVIVDDYVGMRSCREATDDYRRARGITEPLIPIDWMGAYWRRSL
jgi:O-methyltransferase